MRLAFLLAAISVFVSLVMIGKGEYALSQNHTPERVSVYAGLKEIDQKKTHFILVGDTQSTSRWEFWRERNERERKLIADEISRRDPAFVIHLGDLTNRGSSKNKWQEFDDLNRGLREKRIPYFPILGNHEFYGRNEKALGYYFSRFPHLEQERWYSFIWKSLGLIMVDSNFSDLTEDQVENQARWYREEIVRFEKDEKLDHVIVCCHEPPFTNSRVVSPSKEVKATFVDPFVSSRKACLFFSGHSHTYERFLMEGKTFIVSGGGGGPRHKVITDSQKRPFQDLYPGPELRSFHFCEIELRDNNLMFKVHQLEADGMFMVAEEIKRSL